MGIILGALGGAGEAVSDYIDKRMALDDKQLDRDSALDKLRLDSQLTQQRAEALEMFKANVVNQQRSQMVDRVNTAAGQIGDEQMEPIQAQEQAGIVDRDSWTQEQQDAVDQSNALTRSGIIKKALSDGSAGIRSGDITPEQAATLNTKSDALLYKTLYEQTKEDGRNERSDKRNDVLMQNSDNRLAVLLAHFDKQGQGNPNKETLQYLDSTRKEVSSEEQTLRSAYTAELNTARNRAEVDKIKATYQAKFDDVTARRRLIEQDFNTLRSRLGLSPTAGSTTQGDAAAPGGGIPPGWSVRVK